MPARREAKALGTLWQENGVVFPSQVGTPLGGRNLIRHFKRMLERSGLASTLRIHDLRHTCATLQLKQGVHSQNRTGASRTCRDSQNAGHLLPRTRQFAKRGGAGYAGGTLLTVLGPYSGSLEAGPALFKALCKIRRSEPYEIGS